MANILQLAQLALKSREAISSTASKITQNAQTAIQKIPKSAAPKVTVQYGPSTATGTQTKSADELVRMAMTKGDTNLQDQDWWKSQPLEVRQEAYKALQAIPTKTEARKQAKYSQRGEELKAPEVERRGALDQVTREQTKNIYSSALQNLPYVKISEDVAKGIVNAPETIWGTPEERAISKQREDELFQHFYTGGQFSEEAKRFGGVGDNALVQAKSLYENLTPEKKQSLVNDYFKKQEKAYEDYQDQMEHDRDLWTQWFYESGRAGGVEAVKYFSGSPVREYTNDPQQERADIIREALIDIPGAVVRGFLDGKTMGFTESIAPDKLSRQDAKYNKQLQANLQAAEQVMKVVATFAGGFSTYKAIADKVGNVLSKVPGVSTLMKEAPTLTAMTLNNTGEELVEMAFRKATGQEYSQSDFIAGMLMGGAFESLGPVSKWLFKPSKQKQIVNALEKTIETFSKQEGRVPTKPEFNEIVNNLDIGNGYKLGDAYGEARLAFNNMQGRDSFMPGRTTMLNKPGMPTMSSAPKAGLPKTALETPSAKDYTKYANQAKDIEFKNLDDMKLIRARDTGDIVGVQNRAGDAKYFDEGYKPADYVEPELKPLFEEAKKYKSFEDFENSIYDKGQFVDVVRPKMENVFTDKARDLAGKVLSGKRSLEPIAYVKDIFVDNQLKNIFKDIDDVSIYSVPAKELGAKGVVRVDGDNVKILLSEASVNTYDKTLVEEMIHALQVRKGRIQKRGLSYAGDTTLDTVKYISDVNEQLAKNARDNIKKIIDTKAGGYDLKDIWNQANKVSTEKNLPKSQHKTLLAVHNLSEANLQEARKLGGLANPSIATIDVNKGGLEGFGDITLVGSRDLVDPKSMTKGATFGADVYSPRFPSSKTDVDYSQASEMKSELSPYSIYGQTPDYIDFLNTSDLKNELKYATVFQNKFLKEKGIEVKPVMTDGKIDDYDSKRALREYLLYDNKKLSKEFDTYIDNYIDGKGLKKKLYAGTTPSGSQRWVDYTLENASKLMNKEARQGGESFFYGLGNVRGELIGKYKSLKDIKASQDKIVSKSDFEVVKEKYNDEFDKLNEKLVKYDTKATDDFGDYERRMRALGDYLSGKDVAWFKEQFPNIPDNLKQEIEGFRKLLNEMPTEYFETKYSRPVKFNEFKAAVVPDNVSSVTIKSLEEDGLEIVKYKAGDEADRLAKLRQFSSGRSEYNPALKDYAFYKAGKEGVEGVDYPGRLEGPEAEKLPWESDAEYTQRVGVTQRARGEGVDPAVPTKKYLIINAENKINKYIDDVLKPSLENKETIRGGLSKSETGEVIGRTGTTTLKDEWLNDFYKLNKRYPKASELRDIAIDHLSNGYKQFGIDPDASFNQLKQAIEEAGLRIPDEPVKVPKLDTRRPETIAKDLAKMDLTKMKSTNATIAEYKMDNPRLSKVVDEVARRGKFEKAIKDGTLKLADNTEAMKKIRKSGGLGMDMLGLIEKVPGKVIKGTLKTVGTVLDTITNVPGLRDFKNFARDKLVKLTPKAGLSDDVYKVIRDLEVSRSREYKGIADIGEQLSKITGKGVDSNKVYKYLSGEDVEMPSEVKKIIDPIRDEIDIEGLRQVLNGNLPKETYMANFGQYMRRLYGAHQVDGFSPTAQKYNTLKNAFIEKGLDGKEAEEAIYGIMTKNIKDKYASMMPSAGVKTGGDFTKARKLGDDNLSLAIRDFLGEIQDPQFTVMRTLFDLKRSRLNAEFLSDLSKTEAVKDAVPAGQFDKYKLVEGKSWGELDGKYVDRTVFRFMEEMNGTYEKQVKWLSDLNNFIKANLTVRNPAGQFRNLTSNFATSQAILGHNYISLQGVNDLRKAIGSIKSQDEFYQELVAYGRIGESSITREMANQAESLFKQQGTPKNIISKLDGVLSKSYEFGDNLFLMANYQKLRKKGLDPVNALREANRVTPDYSEIPPVIARARRSLVGLPFVTWRYKVYPELLKAAIQKPLTGTMPIWGPWLLSEGLSSQMHLTDEEKEVMKTRVYRDGKMPLYRDEKGDVIYFDYGQYTPYADLFKGRWTPEDSALGALPEQLEGYVSGSIPGIGSFPVQMLINLTNNYDPFTGREITFNDAWTPGWAADIAGHLAPNLLPVLGMSANNFKRVLKGDMGVQEGLMRSLFGMKFEATGIGRFETEEKYSDPSFSMNPSRTAIYNSVKEAAALAESGDIEGASRIIKELNNKYPDQKDYIKSRKTQEKNKAEGKSKTQSTIRTELMNIAGVAKSDNALATVRYKELLSKYPEYKKYIKDQKNKIKQQMK